MLERVTHSLSARLLILFICAGAVLLLLVGSLIGKGFAGHVRTGIRPFVTHYIELMQREIGSPPELEKARELTRGIPVEVHGFSPDQSWSTASQVPDKNDLDTLFAGKSQSSNRYRQFQIRSRGEQLFLHSRNGNFDLYFQVNQPRRPGHGGTYGLTILLSIFGILLLIYYATKSLFRPIDDIQRGIKIIGSGQLDHRIGKRRDDQLGDLAAEVNAMADDISVMLEAKRQLLLGISHELRSPLTRSRVHLALMEDSDSKREVEKDIESMENMIAELLESERLKGRHASLKLERIRLDQLIREQVQDEFKRRVEIMELVEVEAELDTGRIKLLLRNLLQNAIKHSVDPERRPTVSLVNEPGHYCIYVTDSGEGIDPDQIPHLTEPFYRADPSRQRKTGGYGLGLHLCRMIVEAHGGELSIASEDGFGTTIRCSFPSPL